MNHITITTLDEAEIELSIPENLNEITFGQLMAMQDTELTNFETLSLLSGVPVDILYDAKSYQEVTDNAKVYIDLFSYGTQQHDLNKLPRLVSVNHAGKQKIIKLSKRLSIEPAGAFMAASKIISAEVYAHIDLYGEDTWKQNFNPSLQGCAGVVDAFLYCQVTGKLWSEQGRESFAGDMGAADVLIIAKHFFNAFPDLNYKQPANKMRERINAVLGRFKALISKNGVTYQPNGLKFKE